MIHGFLHIFCSLYSCHLCFMIIQRLRNQLVFYYTSIVHPSSHFYAFVIVHDKSRRPLFLFLHLPYTFVNNSNTHTFRSRHRTVQYTFLLWRLCIEPCFECGGVRSTATGTWDHPVVAEQARIFYAYIDDMVSTRWWGVEIYSISSIPNTATTKATLLIARPTFERRCSVLRFQSQTHM